MEATGWISKMSIVVAVLVTVALGVHARTITKTQTVAAAPRTLLTVSHSCMGTCWELAAWNLIIFEDRTALYRASKSPQSDAIISKKGSLSAKEWEELVELVRSRSFLSANAAYDSHISLLDIMLSTTVSYDGPGVRKQIHLRNYIARDNPTTEDPPVELNRIILITNEIIERISRQ